MRSRVTEGLADDAREMAEHVILHNLRRNLNERKIKQSRHLFSPANRVEVFIKYHPSPFSLLEGR